MCGVSGRETGQVRLRVMPNTQGKTLCAFVEHFTQTEATVYTDEYDSYNALERPRLTVCHAQKEWARDGDGVRATPVHSKEGCWVGLRTFLRVFCGVHKRSLSICRYLRTRCQSQTRLAPIVSAIV